MDRPIRIARRRAILATAGMGALAALPAAQAASARDLTPSTTEGPFYRDVGLTDADIARGLKGTPLDVRIEVVDRHGSSLRGCRVDLWHCDARGDYSAFGERRAETFLRGGLVADAAGRVAFWTVYPGWYEGRTAHLHLKVFAGTRCVLTTQLFLPDALSEFLYTQVPAYQRDRVRETLNRNDGIALEAGAGAMGAVREAGDRYVLAATMVVDRDATSREAGPPMRPPRDGRRGPPPGGRGPAAIEPAARLALLVPSGRSD